MKIWATYHVSVQINRLWNQVRACSDDRCHSAVTPQTYKTLPRWSKQVLCLCNYLNAQLRPKRSAKAIVTERKEENQLHVVVVVVFYCPQQNKFGKVLYSPRCTSVQRSKKTFCDIHRSCRQIEKCSFWLK